MMLDPELVTVAAMTMAAAWTMCFAGLKKHLLEPKRRRRVCPSCGRSIPGRVCDAH